MKILVTDGNNRAALAITRSLGRKGYTIVVGATAHPSLASSSKYCSETVFYPCPISSPGKFIDCIIQIIKDCTIDIVLPVSDVTTIPIAAHKATLENFCDVPVADHDAVESAADKARLFHVAKELGVAIPQTIPVNSGNQRIDLPEAMKFPLAVKPCRSRILTDNGWISTSVSYVNKPSELSKTISGIPPRAFPVLLQERIVGPGIGVFTCYNEGKPIVFFSHRRLREKPPSGGVSVLRESIPVPEQAQKYSELLLNHMSWHGVAMVEFKMDERDNLPKLMEINGRFWGSLQLAIDAGVDFPRLLVEIAEGKNIAPASDYRVGIKTRWLLGDIDSLLLMLFKRKDRLNLPKGHRSTFNYCIDFFKFRGDNLHYEILSRDDIKPWLYELRKWLIK